MFKKRKERILLFLATELLELFPLRNRVLQRGKLSTTTEFCNDGHVIGDRDLCFVQLIFLNLTMISWQDFEKIDLRVGTVLEAKDFQEVHNPAYKLRIDFGDLGIKNSSAQITKLYKEEDLIGRQVIAVINFPPKQIANFMSECLVLGAVLEDGKVVLLDTERKVENGTKIS